MDPVSSSAAASEGVDLGTATLEGLARIRQRFLDAGIALRNRPEVTAARTEMDCRAYRSGTTIELYLEADVTGRTVCWWLDASWADSQWTIAASVAENRDDAEYQNQLRAFPIRYASRGDGLIIGLELAAAELLATVTDVEFLAPAV